MTQSRQRHNHRLARAFILAAALAGIHMPVGSAQAQVPFIGGPTYDATTGTGYRSGSGFLAGNDAGTGIGIANKYVSGVDQGYRAVRWDASGNALELGNLGTDASGYTYIEAKAINASGLTAGYANKYVSGIEKGSRAVRWDALGNALELGNLGTDASGVTYSRANALNASGLTGGQAAKYVSGIYKSDLAVLWDASGNALELGNLGTDASGYTHNYANAINASGLTAGYGRKYVSGGYKGARAVRWDASGNVLELGNLGTSTSGFIDDMRAYAINASGQTAGYAYKYVSNYYAGARAVRWDASGNALELGILGSLSSGFTFSQAHAINASGQTAGYAQKYVSDIKKGDRAVLWDASGNALELGNLGTDASGLTNNAAYAINASGLTAGYAQKYVSESLVGSKAVYWNPDGSIVDLNTLISPTAGWTLTLAHDISDTGWITGAGLFDPDGPGGQAAYQRLFIMQVPEPASLSTLTFVGCTLLCRRAKNRSRI